MSQIPSSRNLVNLRLPAEWESHESCWMAWPAEGELWRDHLAGVRLEFAALGQAIVQNSGERLDILVRNADDQKAAQQALGKINVRFHLLPHDDLWLRDTSCIFAERSGKRACVAFRFNGWGNKFPFQADQYVSARIAQVCGLKLSLLDIFLEGGAIEHNGAGTMLTTKQCVLNDNRNPGLTLETANQIFADHLGMSSVIWVERGLDNDHTDGHIDNLARFVNESTVVCMKPELKSDPNYQILHDIMSVLEKATDAHGKALNIETLPSVGRLIGDNGQILPASYMNFYIGNKSIVLPIYGSEQDQQAADTLASLFPTRTVVPLSSTHLLHGGGSFHCITQQMPNFEGAQ